MKRLIALLLASVVVSTLLYRQNGAPPSELNPPLRGAHTWSASELVVNLFQGKERQAAIDTKIACFAEVHRQRKTLIKRYVAGEIDFDDLALGIENIIDKNSHIQVVDPVFEGLQREEMLVTLICMDLFHEITGEALQPSVLLRWLSRGVSGRRPIPVEPTAM